MEWVLLVLLLAAYFLPTSIALSKRSWDFVPLFFLNVILGWTVLGWFLLLLWAISIQVRPRYVTIIPPPCSK